ncbi:hypothetical protein B0T17DRAFT_494491 [Bombardia bombarda]|uniref:NmrA-like domain-containing protein n=1 Tax=Bombardia bombarda TaxID=252184 RepID=A0AA39WUW2_9PEZI|nr:hypothetical protein B0T17DRAFT_494491 [Bombardia bombarda]
MSDSKKIVTIVGATGSQGKGVVSAILNSSNPSAYHIRAITRNPSGAPAQALSAQGIEVVQADVNSLPSLVTAFAGSHIIFAVTNFWEPFISFKNQQQACSVETRQGLNLALAVADPTVLPTLERYIWSTIPDAMAISGGKYLIPHFESKNKVDRYIREALPQLYAKTTFLWVSYYHYNYVWFMFKPYWVASANAHVQVANYAGDTPLHTIGDVSVNITPFVRAVVEGRGGEEEEGEEEAAASTVGGRVVFANLATPTADEMLQTWAKAKGTRAQLVRISGKDYRKLWPVWADEIGLMMEFWDECRNECWPTVDSEGRKVLTAEDLGIKADELQGLEEAFRELDMDVIS